MQHQERLNRLCQQIEQELREDILPYWMNQTVDREHGGFYGEVSNSNQINNDAAKGCILNSRMLWTFSSAFLMYHDARYLDVARHAYEYLLSAFWDNEFGGLYFSVDRHKQPVEAYKQIYNQSFGIYGLSEYYRATGNAESLTKAIELYRAVEERSSDPVHGGYTDAFTRDWQPTQEKYVSPERLHAVKTMNTHLHLMEAYTNLARVWDAPELREKLRHLIELFVEKIIHPDTLHLKMYFTQDWRSQTDDITYGHDIEASWLMYEAAQVLGDEQILKRITPVVLGMAERTLAEGVDNVYGGVYNEKHGGKEIDREKVWWVQSEALVGFLNAYELTRRDEFLDAVSHIWDFTQRTLIDLQYGEWIWSVTEQGEPLLATPKAFTWKCPYHNGRACLESVARIRHLLKRVQHYSF